MRVARLGLVLLWLACPFNGAQAQPEPQPTSDQATESAAAPDAPTAPIATDEVESAEAGSAAPAAQSPADPEVAELLDTLAANDERLEQVQATVDEMMIMQLEAEPVDEEPEVLRIYGFFDVGVQRVWIDETSPLAGVFNSANATSFVVGNINTYLDLQPHPDWRGLVELRFTSAPHGEITNFGGLYGTFNRVSTEQFDPHAPTVNSPMWGGYTVIERAHIDWQESSAFNLRVGSFFTPFGIWNMDHGSPTLISLNLPQTIVTKIFPLRQTGIMAHGMFFLSDWELGYYATLTNGRQELSNFAFSDDRGYGGRLYVAHDPGSFNIKLGVSGFLGHVEDKVVNLTAVYPQVVLDNTTSVEYDEWVLGADLSLDVGSFRLRTEASLHRIKYATGKHATPSALGGASVAGATRVSRYEGTGYVLGSYRLPWLGLEPFAICDIIMGPLAYYDLLVITGGGLTVHLNQSVQWKMQYTRSRFFDVEEDSDQSIYDLSSITSRLIVVF